MRGSWRLSGLVAPVRARAELAGRWADYWGIPVTFTSGFRSLEEQARLRAEWLAGLSPYPVNRPGDSAHNFGLAFDSDVPDELYPAWDYIRSRLGFALYANDVVHAEVPGWRRFVT